MNKEDKFVIQGLAGKKTLKGIVHIHGAKNAALKAMAASVLFNGPVQLKNIPNTEDVHTMSEVLRKLGADVSWKVEETKAVRKLHEGEGRESILEIDSSGIFTSNIDPKLAGSMRASVVLTGPLLARFGKVSFPAPGGCVIGARPIDIFIDGYKKMGATVKLDHEKSIYKIEAPKGLAGQDIFFNKITVGGTETLMMAATLANGTTVLKNCAMEPEIVSVAEWLISCGAKIEGVGTPTITIQGLNKKLLSPKCSYLTVPDRITAGSFLVLGALCAQDLIIRGCRPAHLDSVINILRDSGVEINVSDTHIQVLNKKVAARKSFSVITHEYPGIPTDIQPILATYLTQTSGEGIIFETIFEGRFKYVEDLADMGANIKIMNPREILVKGPTALNGYDDGEELTAHDIRAGFAIVMAALTAKGQSVVNNVHLIDRGYEKLEEILSGLGADVKRICK